MVAASTGRPRAPRKPLPSKGATSRSTTGRPILAVTRNPTETSPSTRVRGRKWSSGMRASSAGPSTWDRASKRRSPGNSTNVRAEWAAIAWDSTDASVVRGWHSRSPRPTSISANCPGRRASTESAPSSTGTPATSETRSLPPIAGAASRTACATPDHRLAEGARAAAKPEMPPSITATCCGRPCGMRHTIPDGDTRRWNRSGSTASQPHLIDDRVTREFQMRRDVAAIVRSGVRVLVLLAGCGGSGDSADTSGSSAAASADGGDTAVEQRDAAVPAPRPT